MKDFWESIEELWRDTRGDPRVCVAILDGPVDQSHQSLHRARLTQIESPLVTKPVGGIASQHGTHVASIIFGQHDGPVKGIAPNCRGLLIPIFKDDDRQELPVCSQADLGWAIDTAVSSGAHIINISAGEFPGHGATDPLLEKAIRNCVDSGVLVVAAAGNQGCNCLQIPGALPSVLAVGATNRQGELLGCENFSDIYEERALLAPGEAILGALPSGGTSIGSGTSYATAIVSGVAALLLSLQLKYEKDPNSHLVREVLINSALKDSKKIGPGRTPGNRLNIRGATHLLKEKLGIATTAQTRSSASDGYHREGSSPYDTAYAITSEALNDHYGNAPSEKFGSVDITLPGGHSYTVRDLHYSIGQDETGMHFIPVSDTGTVTLSNGISAPGYEAIDNYLRQQMRLKAEDPIYALLSYIRPEEHSIDLLHLPSTQKIQMGHKHLAAYVGKGRTTHVLPRKTEWKGEGPLDMMWNVDRYPANVHIISLHGVSLSTLNRNAHIVDSILAAGAKSPEDTENLTCQTIDINTTLQYYRDSIRRAEYLEDLAWFTNCAVHTTTVINVFLNIPHNELSFQQIFGQDGSQLWIDFKHRYKEIHGEPFSSDDETYFEPLWKLAGLSADKIRPLTFGEYNAFNAAKAETWLEEYTGRKPLEAGKGMAWTLETVVDLVNNFMNMYVSFQDVGGIVASGELLFLRHMANARLRITERIYLELVSPLITKLIVAECLIKATKDRSSLQIAATELYAWLKRADEQYSLETESSVKQVIEKCVESANREISELSEKKGNGQVNAADWLKEALTPELDRLRSIAVALTGDGSAGFFSSPSILHKIALGLHPKSPFVGVRTLCTVMDQAELSLRPSPGALYGAKPGPPFAENTPQGVKIRHKGNDEQEYINMKDLHISLDKETGKAEHPSPQSGDSTTVTPSMDGIKDSNCDSGCLDSPAQLVYALGRIDYDFVSQSRRDSIKQKMDESKHPEEPKDVLGYLDENPHDASAIQWTLNLEGTPIYAIEPRGPFAREAYEFLRQFLREQITEGVERVSLPGLISGMSRLRSGIVVPVVVPEIRGLYSWTTEALVTAVCGSIPKEKEQKNEYETKRQGVTNFLERVYYEIRNFGREPQERAINFAATNAFEIEKVYEKAIQEEMELDAIEVELSPVCSESADCWDVKLLFFFPQRQVQTVRRVYRFTVDVADVVPATIGPVRSWSIR